MQQFECVCFLHYSNQDHKFSPFLPPSSSSIFYAPRRRSRRSSSVIGFIAASTKFQLLEIVMKLLEKRAGKKKQRQDANRSRLCITSWAPWFSSIPSTSPSSLLYACSIRIIGHVVYAPPGMSLFFFFYLLLCRLFVFFIHFSPPITTTLPHCVSSSPTNQLTIFFFPVISFVHSFFSLPSLF